MDPLKETTMETEFRSFWDRLEADSFAQSKILRWMNEWSAYEAKLFRGVRSLWAAKPGFSERPSKAALVRTGIRSPLSH